jgi:hypothetical protein
MVGLYSLDFLALSLAQPNSESVCNVDSFQVAGAINKIPIICGDANGQHSNIHDELIWRHCCVLNNWVVIIIIVYLMLPRVSTSVQLVMTLGTSSSPRYWRIKIAMLHCDSEFLGNRFELLLLTVITQCLCIIAPEDCLQYFTTSTGSVMTFNWMDTTNRATRQLASQDYYICFRTELVNRQV